MLLVLSAYNYLENLRITQPPQLISALDKKSHPLKIVVIQPPLIGYSQGTKITEFKLNMSQFSIVYKVYLFKQSSKLICSDLINALVSKEKLQRDFRKLENRLRTEQAKKKAL